MEDIDGFESSQIQPHLLNDWPDDIEWVRNLILSSEVPAISASESVHYVYKYKEIRFHMLCETRSHRIRDRRDPSLGQREPVSWLMSIVYVFIWRQLNDITLAYAIPLLHLDCSGPSMSNENTGGYTKVPREYPVLLESHRFSSPIKMKGIDRRT
jgi:hypothetical protein